MRLEAAAWKKGGSGHRYKGWCAGTARKAAVLQVLDSCYAHIPMMVVYRGCQENGPVHLLILVTGYMYVGLGRRAGRERGGITAFLECRRRKLN